eukprot:TRINITY_DN1772_c0_g2_i2.p1 TRINITY_DN1772_c0_g2~~TRINITY_DN1772_c0_g2_i2.p1  ORF type:complete len:600 (-),score=233.76 TRINITY_DN1772_c0_g2_i2:254-2053(-)
MKRLSAVLLAVHCLAGGLAESVEVDSAVAEAVALANAAERDADLTLSDFSGAKKSEQGHDSEETDLLDQLGDATSAKQTVLLQKSVAEKEKAANDLVRSALNVASEEYKRGSLEDSALKVEHKKPHHKKKARKATSLIAIESKPKKVAAKSVAAESTDDYLDGDDDTDTKELEATFAQDTEKEKPAATALPKVALVTKKKPQPKSVDETPHEQKTGGTVEQVLMQKLAEKNGRMEKMQKELMKAQKQLEQQKAIETKKIQAASKKAIEKAIEKEKEDEAEQLKAAEKKKASQFAKVLAKKEKEMDAKWAQKEKEMDEKLAALTYDKKEKEMDDKLASLMAEKKERQMQKLNVKLTNLLSEKAHLSKVEVASSKSKDDAELVAAKVLKQRERKHVAEEADADTEAQAASKDAADDNEAADSSLAAEIIEEIHQERKKAQEKALFSQNERLEVARSKLASSHEELQEIHSLRGSYEDEEGFAQEISEDEEAVTKELHSKALAKVLTKIRKEMRLADKAQVLSALDEKSKQLTEEEPAWEKVIDMETQKLHSIKHEDNITKTASESSTMTGALITFLPKGAMILFICTVATATMNKLAGPTP